MSKHTKNLIKKPRGDDWMEGYTSGYYSGFMAAFRSLRESKEIKEAKRKARINVIHGNKRRVYQLCNAEISCSPRSREK